LTLVAKLVPNANCQGLVDTKTLQPNAKLNW